MQCVIIFYIKWPYLTKITWCQYISFPLQTGLIAINHGDNSTVMLLYIFRHLDCFHALDEKGAAQARVQGYVVRELEEKVML